MHRKTLQPTVVAQRARTDHVTLKHVTMQSKQWDATIDTEWCCSRWPTELGVLARTRVRVLTREPDPWKFLQCCCHSTTAQTGCCMIHVKRCDRYASKQPICKACTHVQYSKLAARQCSSRAMPLTGAETSLQYRSSTDHDIDRVSDPYSRLTALSTRMGSKHVR